MEYLSKSDRSKSKNANKLLGDKYKIKNSVESANLHSYLDLAEFIIMKGDSSDLEKLWKRMLVNICMGNKDDNFHAHIFIQNENNWKLLAPHLLSFAYDCDTQSEGLSLNIDDKSNKFEPFFDV